MDPPVEENAPGKSRKAIGTSDSTDAYRVSAACVGEAVVLDLLASVSATGTWFEMNDGGRFDTHESTRLSIATNQWFSLRNALSHSGRPAWPVHVTAHNWYVVHFCGLLAARHAPAACVAATGRASRPNVT
jgi:hypothetical protein